MPGLRDYAANREDDSSEGNSSSDAETHRIFGDIQSVYDRLPPGGKWRAVIPGASHFTFSNDGAVVKSSAIRGLFHLFGGLRMDGRRHLVVTAYSLRTFFDMYLKSQDSRFQFSSPTYP